MISLKTTHVSIYYYEYWRGNLLGLSCTLDPKASSIPPIYLFDIHVMTIDRYIEQNKWFS